jgi:FRG domain
VADPPHDENPVTPENPVDLSDQLGFQQTIPTVSYAGLGRMLAPRTPGDFAFCLQVVLGGFAALAWRGQKDIGWRIDSSLWRRSQQRNWLGPALAYPEERVREAEKRLLERARAAGHGFRQARRLGDLELLALLQHHGAATRLLDCTMNAFVAAWFASRRDPNCWGLLAGFDLREARGIRVEEERDLDIASVLELADPDQTLFWRPAALSPRMAAQQALFVFGRTISAAWGSIATRGETIQELGDVPGMTLIALAPVLKQHLGDMWDTAFGITTETMFPDLDGFAQAHGVGEEFPQDFFEGENLAIPDNRVV